MSLNYNSVQKKKDNNLNTNNKTIVGAINELKDKLVVTNIVDNRLVLTTDKWQKTTMTDGVEIVLPTVTEFTEIHLFFSASSDMTLTFPTVKWESTPTIESGKVYEYVFTYIDETLQWLCGYVVYS